MWWLYFPHFRGDQVPCFERLLSTFVQSHGVVRPRVGPGAPAFEFLAFCTGPRCLSKKREGDGLAIRANKPVVWGSLVPLSL